MNNAIMGLCTLEMHLSGVLSLKEKRGLLKRMFARVRKQFNVSIAEIDHHDKWQSTRIAIVTVTNSTKHAQQSIDTISKWIEANFPDHLIVDQEIEII